MAESRLSLPADVTDPLSLRRSLAAIIRELDLITGVKGTDPYVKESELPNVTPTLSGLNEAFSELAEVVANLTESTNTVDDAIEELTDKVNTLIGLTTYTQGSIAMFDFNDTEWALLVGLFQISGLGEDFINPPEALTTGVTYNVYVDSTTTLNDGVVQEVIVEDTTNNSIAVYKRAGDSFSDALTNGWFNVQSV